MSEQTNIPMANDLRYEITIKDHRKQDNIVLYEVVILDLIYRCENEFLIRFKQLKKFHEKLLQLPQHLLLPQFPKTNSFVFWNKTNDSEKKIAQRKRQIEYYLQKLLNNPLFRGKKIVKGFLVTKGTRKRSKSFSKRNQNLKFIQRQKLTKSIEIKYLKNKIK